MSKINSSLTTTFIGQGVCLVEIYFNFKLGHPHAWRWPKMQQEKITFTVRVRGGSVSRGTALQAWRSRVQFPMVSMGFLQGP